MALILTLSHLYFRQLGCSGGIFILWERLEYQISNLPMTASSKCAHSHLSVLQPYWSLIKPTSYPILLFQIKYLNHCGAIVVICFFNFSCYNPHAGILAPPCIVPGDYSQSTNWHREVKECSRIFSFPSVFRAYASSLYRCWNEGYNWVAILQKYIQHI